MICAVPFVNIKGETIISRHYRDGFDKGIADIFRSQVITSKEVRCVWRRHVARVVIAEGMDVHLAVLLHFCFACFPPVNFMPMT